MNDNVCLVHWHGRAQWCWQIGIEEVFKFCHGLSGFSHLNKIGHKWAELVNNRGDTILLFVFGVVGVTCGSSACW